MFRVPKRNRIVNKPPIHEPEPIAPPDPKGPEIDPMPEGPSHSDPVTASGSGDDRSQREPPDDPKRTSKSAEQKQFRTGGKSGPVNP